MKNKEYRVFVVNMDDCVEPVGKPSPEWFDEQGNPSSEAEWFMEYAESTGRVFSLRGFQEGFNSGMDVSDEVDFILITNNY